MAGTDAEPQTFASVIVTARDAETTIGDTLGALGEQTVGADRFEVVVIDDGSRDRTGDVVRASGRATLLQTGSPIGAYGARNLGLRIARGGVVAITDADCRPAPDWLELALADLVALEADLLGGRIEVSLSGSPTRAELVDAALHLDQRRYVQTGFAAFANFVCRRSVFDRVGTFNSELISNGDREFCMRATAAGFALAYSGRAVVTHAPLRRARDVARRSYRMGLGRGQTIGRADGPARAWQRNWLGARDYLPRSLIGRDPIWADRLRECGDSGSRGRLRRVEIASYGLVGLPMLAGFLTGSVRVRSGRSRA